jgi:hypothetical protein
LWPASDNGHYGAHGLALRNEIRTWWFVEKGAVAKNPFKLLFFTKKVEEKRGYPSPQSVGGKWAFNIDIRLEKS